MDFFSVFIAGLLIYAIFATSRWKRYSNDAELWEGIADELYDLNSDLHNDLDDALDENDELHSQLALYSALREQNQGAFVL